ncbi:MAG: N-6 DNA methylase [Candidatus Omnitrophota bacterium]
MENDKNIAVIRLITRMIFIWFMREKENLVPNDLFKEDKIKTILKDVSPDVSTYYKAVLQNLFFATLSTKKNERDFRNEKRFQGKNKDFGNQYVYRYHGLFSSPDEIKTYFEKIPFLNGGLFECLDDGINNYYVDGFTERKEYQPIIPNFLFFGVEQKADLNTAYGTKNKTYKVRGLLNILSSFNFTIDENSPDDQDIALDPELLGRVFENLLASFNPETSTTARKATGSYYTPREIVDYMVSESLKAYFKTHLSAISDLDKKIEQLFSTGSEKNPFDKSESKKIVELIESVKIVDPAVGSGAFPMGALNKLVFILNKIDPGNELWKQAQLSAADTIPDPRIKQDTKKRIEEFFKGKNADYGRKLYLIQKCIYGVDIQQIAVEIAKLRFFISLLVDENIDRDHPDGNWGIEPLPNLDFKIMQGNSLLEEYEGVKLFDEKLIASIDFDKQKLIESIKQKQSELQKEYLYLHAKNKLTKIKQVELNEELKRLDKQLKGLNKQDNKIEESAGLFDAQNEAKQKRKVLKRLHKEFFETNEKETKDKMKKQIEKIVWDLIEATLKEQNKTSELKKIEQFKKSNTKPFFLWKLHFADVFENGGFDIVIANPPYVDSETMVKEQPVLRQRYSELYSTAKGNWDLYVPFLELGHKILTNTGTACFITPNKWFAIGYGKEIRKKLIGNIYRIANCNSVKVFEAGNSPVVTIFGKNSQAKEVRIDKFDINYSIGHSLNIKRRFLADNLGLALSDFLSIAINIRNQPKNISDYYVAENPCSVSEAYEIKKVLKDLSSYKDSGHPYFRFVNTGTIDHFLSLWGKKNTTYLKSKYYNPVVNKLIFQKLFPKRYKQTIKPKLIVSGMRHFESFLDEDGQYIAGKSTEILFKNSELSLKVALGILNSRLISFYIKQAYSVLGIDGGINFTTDLIESLPIPEFNTIDIQKPFIKIVDKILSITKSSDYLGNPAKKEEVKEYEKQIDQFVYKLYDLTPEEIKIIENK